MTDVMDTGPALANITIPWGRQEVSLHELAFEAGGTPLLRVRIREGRRFTIFDIDAASAAAWGQAMVTWAAEQTETAGPDT